LISAEKIQQSHPSQKIIGHKTVSEYSRIYPLHGFPDLFCGDAKTQLSDVEIQQGGIQKNNPVWYTMDLAIQHRRGDPGDWRRLVDCWKFFLGARRQQKIHEILFCQ